MISALSTESGRAWSNVTLPRRILILFAHPALRKSRINRRLLLAAESVAGITVRDLYGEYPDFMIDVQREHELQEAHEVILYQHPFYWYSCPAILKEWQDLVLEHGFAYGEKGRALEGKWQASVLSTGGPDEAYRVEGHNRFTFRQLLAPCEQTARLCRMVWLPPFLVQGSVSLDDAGLYRRAADYVKTLEILRDGTVPLATLRELERLNHCINSAIGGAV